MDRNIGKLIDWLSDDGDEELTIEQVEKELRDAGVDMEKAKERLRQLIETAGREPAKTMKTRTEVIALMVSLASDPASEMYYKDRGRLVRRTGAAHRSAFWHGFDAYPKKYVAGSWCAWAYAAGRKFAKKAPDWVPGAIQST